MAHLVGKNFSSSYPKDFFVAPDSIWYNSDNNDWLNTDHKITGFQLVLKVLIFGDRKTRPCKVLKLDIGSDKSPEKVLIFDHKGAEKSIRHIRICHHCM